jgi:serine/threonine protein kinase
MKICSKNNKNSLECYEYFNNDKNFVLVMELCDKNLSQLLMERIKKKKKCFSHDEILKILEELNNTFQIMNEKIIIHRDLKLENILIKYNNNKRFNIKITDYGSSKKLMSLSRSCNIGTTIYMAPEILNGEKYNYKCDLWSLGIIIYKLYFGKSPFPGESEEAIKKYIEQFGNKLLKKNRK